jgi:hypothetical protein
MQPIGGLVSFSGSENTETGLAADVRATVLVDISKNVWLEFHGDYWISQTINQVSMADTRWGVTTAELDFRGLTVSFSFSYFLF